MIFKNILIFFSFRITIKHNRRVGDGRWCTSATRLSGRQIFKKINTLKFNINILYNLVNAFTIKRILQHVLIVGSGGCLPTLRWS